jgi:hypothetical protein
MDSNVGTLFGGFAVAAVSAVTFVAYKHPRAYAKLYLWLCGANFAGVMGMVIWNFSNLATSNTILRSGLSPDKIAATESIINITEIPAWWIFLGGFVAFYLLFLTSLPYWLIEQEDPNKEHK